MSEIGLAVELMDDGSYDVVLTVGGVTYRRMETSEMDAMLAANETQGVLEAGGVEFCGRLSAPRDPPPQEET